MFYALCEVREKRARTRERESGNKRVKKVISYHFEINFTRSTQKKAITLREKHIFKLIKSKQKKKTIEREKKKLLAISVVLQ